MKLKLRRTRALLVAVLVTGFVGVGGGTNTLAAPVSKRVVPAPPEACSDEQVLAGTDLSNCIIWGELKPVDAGWGAAPFPFSSTGSLLPGFVWNGWSYNGSYALKTWEAGLVSNSAPVGTIRAGLIRSRKGMQELFEGFLRDVIDQGYVIENVGTYTHRCTSSTTKTCTGLTDRSLSFHSWGAAVDINTGTNPEQLFTTDATSSACNKPVMTDITDAIIKSAQKWGLVWGGYGWTSSCRSPDAVIYQIRRDPHHFEFRGTPEQAAAIIAHNTGAVSETTVPATTAAPSTTAAPTTTPPTTVAATTVPATTAPPTTVPPTTAPPTTVPPTTISVPVTTTPLTVPAPTPAPTTTTPSGATTLVIGGTATAPVVKRGSSGVEVTILTLALRAAGAEIAVSSRFDSNVDAAVRKFQNSNHLRVDGVVGPVTWKALRVSFSPDRLPVIRAGSSGPTVAVLTAALAAAGMKVTVSTTFGPEVDAAVRAFQKAQRLTIDGVVGPRTWNALKGGLLATPLPTMKSGAKGSMVGVLTATLNWYGVIVPVTTTFDAKVDAAVRLFQGANLLAVDGVVGPKTWRALRVTGLSVATQ